MTSELLVAGAANLDRMMYVERIPEQGETIMALNYEEHPGGKGANQAVAAALWGMKVNFIGRTGDDEPGKILKNSLENAGVNTKYLLQGLTPSGIALDFIDPEGNYQAAVLAGANSDLDSADLPEDSIFWESIGLTVMQLECPHFFTEALGLKSKKQGIPVLLNAAPAVPIPNSWWDWIEILVVNEVEAFSLSGIKINHIKDSFACLEILQQRCRKTVITLGENGLVYGTGSVVKHIVAHPVKAVSSLGAGDAFVGAMAAELCKGNDLAKSTFMASLAAAASVTSSGAQTSYLTPHQLKNHPALGEPYMSALNSTVNSPS